METDFGPGHIGTHVWKVEYVGKNLIVSELALAA